MERRPLGATGIDVPVLCLGSMMYGDQMDQKGAFEQMDVCFERGIDFIDTAELYTVPPKAQTQGNSERIVGQWLKDRGRRNKVIIATKVAGRSPIPWLREDGGNTRLTRAQIEFAVDRSLKNLQTDYIDLYQTHWPDRDTQLFGADLRGYEHFSDAGVPFEETLDALGDLVKAGKIRHVGVSNETPWGVMRMLNAHEKNPHAPRIQSIQNFYNLIGREFESGLAEIAIEEKVGLLAYSPIGQGALSGKYLDGAMPEGSRWQRYGRFSRYEAPGINPAVKKYLKIADQFGVDPSALAMQFVTTRPFVTSNIFGASNMAQLDIVFSSLEIDWTDELEKAVGEVHAEFRSPCT
ncbi:MAG: aldo/keto reductase [Pseudomonadota bacterium]